MYALACICHEPPSPQPPPLVRTYFMEAPHALGIESGLFMRKHNSREYLQATFNAPSWIVGESVTISVGPMMGQHWYDI